MITHIPIDWQLTFTNAHTNTNHIFITLDIYTLMLHVTTTTTTISFQIKHIIIFLSQQTT